MSLPQKQLERWNDETFESAKIERENSKLNISVINQWNKFYDNSKKLKDVKYPVDLPVLAFLAKEQINSINDLIKSSEMKTSWLDINKNIITNPNIQTIQILDGTHYLHYDRPNEICESIKNFVNNTVV